LRTPRSNFSNRVRSSRSTCPKTLTISFLRSGYLGRPCENAVVVLIETFLTPQSQTHDSQTQLTPTFLEPGTHKTHTDVPDPHRISCGGSTQALLPRKTLTHKVRSRKPLQTSRAQSEPKPKHKQTDRFAFLLYRLSQAVSRRRTHTLFELAVLSQRLLGHSSSKNDSTVLSRHVQKQASPFQKT